VLSEPTIPSLLAAAHSAPVPPGYELPGGADDETLDGFERRTGLLLPAPLRAWWGAVNGAQLGPGGLFGVRDPDDFLSAERYLRLYPGWAGSGWIPIAADGLGDYWVTAPGPRGGEGWVAFIDCHDDPHRIRSYVASDVLRFLRFLLDQEQGEKRWPSDRAHVLAEDPALADVPEQLAPWRAGA
jgi:cell wall assembly regulator SMI1